MRTEKPGMIAKDYFQISITHIPTGNDVSFDAWVTGFADSFASSWKGTPVYGRMDDLYNFQKTSRKISLAFDVVAANKFEAAKNVRKLNKLAQFLYPVYSAPQGDLGTPNSQTLQAAPLLKVKWNGLISNALDGAGLVGFLNGFSYSPEIESGQFFVKGRGSGKPFMAYQLHRVQFEYTVLHTHLTGWTTRTVDLGGGVSKHIFGGDDARELGSTFPHAISDPIILPTEGDAADETEPDPAAPAPADPATNGAQTPQLGPQETTSEAIDRLLGDEYNTGLYGTLAGVSDHAGPQQAAPPEISSAAIAQVLEDPAAMDGHSYDHGHGGPSAGDEASWNAATGGPGPDGGW